MTAARIRAMRPVISLCIVLSGGLEAATSKERKMSDGKVVSAGLTTSEGGTTELHILTGSWQLLAVTLEQQLR